MRTPALLLAGFALIATQASARSDTDYPHRDWGKVVTLDMSVTEATTCIVRELGRKADVTTIAMDGGADIDVAPHTWPKSEPWQTFKVRPDGAVSELRIFYRHPVRLDGNDKTVEKLKRQCLRVNAITSAS